MLLGGKVAGNTMLAVSLRSAIRGGPPINGVHRTGFRAARIRTGHDAERKANDDACVRRFLKQASGRLG